MEATTPELSPVRSWSPKSSSFSGSYSIVVEEAAKKLTKSTSSVNKSGAPNFFIQHDKVEDSKLRRYLETFGPRLRTVSTTTNVLNDSIIFLLGMPFDRLVRRRTSLRERAQ